MRRGFLGKAGSVLIVAVFLVVAVMVFPLSALTEKEIRSLQPEMAVKPLGERIAFWAERFVGAPYDPDPRGEYVTKGVIVVDERVDCMYLSFRSLELALSSTPEEALIVALDKRFAERGVIEGAGVANYEERFQYGEDMLDSGKWGKEVTGTIGPMTYLPGSRGRGTVGMVSREHLLELVKGEGPSDIPLRSGDFVYFIKSPEKRMVGEIVGHIGILKREEGGLYLIHASGKKHSGGTVKKVLFRDYVRSMPFAGVRVGRFE